MLGLEEEIADAPTEDDVEPSEYGIWPENLAALNLFMSLENQWNMMISPDGEIIRTGMKLDAIELKLKYSNGIPKKAWSHFFKQMEWMERAALSVMRQALSERIQKRADALEEKRKASHE